MYNSHAVIAEESLFLCRDEFLAPNDCQQPYGFEAILTEATFAESILRETQLLGVMLFFTELSTSKDLELTASNLSKFSTLVFAPRLFYVIVPFSTLLDDWFTWEMNSLIKCG